MEIITRSPKGTQDILPGESQKWQYVERILREVATLYGVEEIRVPTFEHTELFQRSVGDTTDVVQKEMYTFEDKGNRSITLRPEGTAGVVRAVMQNGLLSGALPLKVCYNNLSCFRYENTQAGRFREFHQFGAEFIGSAAPAIDAEAIALVRDIFETLGIKDISLEINSIGCPECRGEYYKALRGFLAEKEDELCETCRGRISKNPMRVLDCKSPHCQEIVKGAPRVLDYLCEDCKTHFEVLKKRLDLLGIKYKINPEIVRGLDYYTKTVFEFVSTKIGAQGTVCGGGRYDGLFEVMGGPKTPALGFAIGIERLIAVMKSCEAPFPEGEVCTLYVGSMGEEASCKARDVVKILRDEGFYAECDVMARSVKAQMKYADKIGALYSCIIGETELESGIVQLKNMKNGERADVAISENINNTISILDFIYSDIIPFNLENK